jgi:hypothetical protein
MAIVTDGLPGEGTLLQLLTTPPTTYTTIANVDEIDGFEVGADAIDKFGLGDVVKKRRKSLMIDPGELSLKLRVDPSNAVHKSIYTKTIASDPAADDTFKIVFKDGNATPAFATFNGFFTKYKLTGMKEGENVIVESTVQVNTVPVMTEGTSP